MESETASPNDSSSQSNPHQGTPPKGRVLIQEERCKGCSYCVISCPSDVLAMGGRLNRKGYHLPETAHPERCNGCDMCGLFCPDFAIFGVRNKKDKEDLGDES